MLSFEYVAIRLKTTVQSTGTALIRSGLLGQKAIDLAKITRIAVVSRKGAKILFISSKDEHLSIANTHLDDSIVGEIKDLVEARVRAAGAPLQEPSIPQAVPTATLLFIALGGPVAFAIVILMIKYAHYHRLAH